MDIFNIIKPDVWAPGDQEWIEGERFFEKLVRQYHKIMISGNWYPLGKKTYLPPFKIINIKGFGRVGIGSYTDPETREYDRLKTFLRFDRSRFELAARAVQKADLKILIYHGMADNPKQLAVFLKEWDVVLLSHTQQQTARRIGSVWFVCPGADGEYYSKIKITGTHADSLRVNVNHMPVKLESASDNTVKYIIKNYQPH